MNYSKSSFFKAVDIFNVEITINKTHTWLHLLNIFLVSFGKSDFLSMLEPLVHRLFAKTNKKKFNIGAWHNLRIWIQTQGRFGKLTYHNILESSAPLWGASF